MGGSVVEGKSFFNDRKGRKRRPCGGRAKKKEDFSTGRARVRGMLIIGSRNVCKGGRHKEGRTSCRPDLGTPNMAKRGLSFP